MLIIGIRTKITLVIIVMQCNNNISRMKKGSTAAGVHPTI